METMKRLGIGAVLAALAASALACSGTAESRSAKAPESPSFDGSTTASQGQPGLGSVGSSAPATEADGDAAPAAPERPSEARRSEPTGRPGLGTEWGESRFSRISTVPFVRDDRDTPFATASLFYNDAQGAREMASLSGFRRHSSGSFNLASGAITMGLKDGSGSFFSGFVAGERDYVVGEGGSRYTIVLNNRTDSRFEVVVSVDGLDVMDGKPASFGKRGYLLEPRGELEIDGFRQSVESVAAFRFGSVRGSYAAQKHGDTRNVGVIGVALFNERGDRPSNRAEIQRRHGANPFPGSFATPPN